MKLTPIGDRLIVRRFASDDKTAGGILLPDNAKQKPQKGKIVAVGPGATNPDGSRRPMQVKVGETVLFTSWAGDEFKEHGKIEEVLVMREADILAVLDD